MKIFVTCYLLLFTVISNAQLSVYQQDLQSLRQAIYQTPSYKDQIKGKNEISYQRLYDSLNKFTPEDPESYEYFNLLCQLLFPITDNHLNLNQTTKFRDSAGKKSIPLRAIPQYHFDLDSLRNSLKNKSPDSVEGIFFYENKFEIGVFKVKAAEYAGIILNSNLHYLHPGQLAVYLYEQSPLQFRALYLNPLTHAYTLQPVEKYRNQSLVNSYALFSDYSNTYKKDTTVTDYINIPHNSALFNYTQINDSVEYILIRTFQRNSDHSKLSSDFHKDISSKIHSPHLILDLRNHLGGSALEMKKFYKLMKKYSQKNHLYVLINNRTLSQAEIFTAALRLLSNVMILGQTTKGMIVYGSNYGRTQSLPSGKVSFYPTDMSEAKHLLQYESKGLEPDIWFNNNENWVEQLLKVINTENR